MGPVILKAMHTERAGLLFSWDFVGALLEDQKEPEQKPEGCS